MRALRERNRQHVRVLKESQPCTDCGNFYPHYVMQYDHIGSDKVADVSRLVQAGTYSIARIEAEIAKCELVCANCHAKRSWQRMLNNGEVAESG